LRGQTWLAADALGLSGLYDEQTTGAALLAAGIRGQLQRAESAGFSGCGRLGSALRRRRERRSADADIA
jgi:hypothetical protein